MTSLWKSHGRTIESSPFAHGARHEIAVVGAGITGLSTALILAREGRDVVLLDAGEIAQLATGANTGKASLLQGTRASTLRAHHPASLVRAYVDANRDGQRWLRGFAAEAGVPVVERTAYTYAQAPAGLRDVQAEFDAARDAGLPVRMAGPADLEPLPFPAVGAVALDGQFSIDPDAVAIALAHAFVAAGGTLHTGVRVTGVSVLPSPRVRAEKGDVAAEQIVLATGTPIADRGLYFAKVSAMRSYAMAFALPDGVAVPPGMYLSADAPGRSIRAVGYADGAIGAVRLVVGGNGHPVGRTASEQERYDDLERWTIAHVPGAEPVFRWSAQDYESHNRVPFIGVLPRSAGRIRFATGFAKWGLTNGPAAALRIAAEIGRVPRHDRPLWMTQIGTRLTVPADIGRGAVENAKVGAAAVRGWTGALASPVPVVRPAEGEGVVAERGGRPVAVSTVAGRTRAVSAVCPHLGGVLAWNDAECTWDCPLHASRFAPDGARIEGPAVSDLAVLRDDEQR